MKNLQRCLAENQIQPHTPSRQETAELLGIVDRDLEDARITLLSSDRRFATVYNAALPYMNRPELVEGLVIQTVGDFRPCRGCAS